MADATNRIEIFEFAGPDEIVVGVTDRMKLMSPAFALATAARATFVEPLALGDMIILVGQSDPVQMFGPHFFGGVGDDGEVLVVDDSGYSLNTVAEGFRPARINLVLWGFPPGQAPPTYAQLDNFCDAQDDGTLNVH